MGGSINGERCVQLIKSYTLGIYIHTYIHTYIHSYIHTGTSLVLQPCKSDEPLQEWRFKRNDKP